MDVDYFLLDDVEEMASSIAAQEKLYHIYNTIIDNGGKVAFTSSFSPEKIKNAESYLTSRFEWGMLAEIKSIDDETTSKICLLYTSPSPRDQRGSRMPSSA